MRMSRGMEILEELLKPRFKYKGVSVNFFGMPAFCKGRPKISFAKEISRLRQGGFIQEQGEFFHITNKGRGYVKRRQDSLSVFTFSFPKSAPKNLIVMFDIPEGKKAEREWFRFHLKKFGYEMIQRSVWVGPSPLPDEFLSYVKGIKLSDCIKTFKLASAYEDKPL